MKSLKIKYLLSKLLPLFIYPIGLVILLGLIGLSAVILGYQTTAAVSVMLAIGILWVSSTYVFSIYIMGALEKVFPYTSIQYLADTDAIVVLTGFNGRNTAIEGGTEVNDAVDRLFYGMRLFKAGKAPRIVLIGGGEQGNQKEAQQMADLLAEFNVSRSAMLLVDNSQNTRENGLEASKTMRKNGINKILLVTVAYHMRRAKSVFEKLGFAVVPAAMNYQARESDSSILDWLPDTRALAMTTLCIKEYLGWWVYRFRGWVD